MRIISTAIIPTNQRFKNRKKFFDTFTRNSFSKNETFENDMDNSYQ